MQPERDIQQPGDPQTPQDGETLTPQGIQGANEATGPASPGRRRFLKALGAAAALLATGITPDVTFASGGTEKPKKPKAELETTLLQNYQVEVVQMNPDGSVVGFTKNPDNRIVFSGSINPKTSEYNLSKVLPLTNDQWPIDITMSPDGSTIVVAGIDSSNHIDKGWGKASKDKGVTWIEFVSNSAGFFDVKTEGTNFARLSQQLGTRQARLNIEEGSIVNLSGTGPYLQSTPLRTTNQPGVFTNYFLRGRDNGYYKGTHTPEGLSAALINGSIEYGRARKLKEFEWQGKYYKLFINGLSQYNGRGIDTIVCFDENDRVAWKVYPDPALFPEGRRDSRLWVADGVVDNEKNALYMPVGQIGVFGNNDKKTKILQIPLTTPDKDGFLRGKQEELPLRGLPVYQSNNDIVIVPSLSMVGNTLVANAQRMVRTRNTSSNTDEERFIEGGLQPYNESDGSWGKIPVIVTRAGNPQSITPTPYRVVLPQVMHPNS